MNEAWHFYPQKPTGPIHNPISGEFFSTEAVGDTAAALVREGIQNTLDARLRRGDGACHPARVRIFLSDATGALAPAKAARWFGSLWPHAKAPGNGIRGCPDLAEGCPFLVFEDFGTTGLTGDTAEYRAGNDVPNHFLNFFRAEGQSDKGESDCGSWGVGKTVFPRASRVSAFIALTVRSDDNMRLLLGRSILKCHRVAGEAYTSDGYFGLRREDDGFALPSSDPAVLADFGNDFCVERTDEYGLSVVVPWYAVDGEGAVSRDKILEAVVRGFFYPILMGDLSVAVATPTSEISFDSSSIIRAVQEIGGGLASDVLPIIELAEWAKTRRSDEFLPLALPAKGGAPQWSVEIIPSEVAERIRRSSAERERIAVRVPMFVEPRDGDRRQTHFDIFFERSEQDRVKPVFVRGELIITDVKSPQVPQVRSLVIAEDGPLAALLRDAETPAHTQWNQGTSKFKDKYKFGAGVIKFVSQSVAALVSILNEAERKPDPGITIDFFSIPAARTNGESVPTPRGAARPDRGERSLVGTSLPPPASRRFRIEKAPGGFVVRNGEAGALPPQLVEILVAYDVRRGNPLKKYHPADFDLGQPPIRWSGTGAKVSNTEGNLMVVTVEDADFNLEVTGFDPNRDLYVRGQVKEMVDAD